MLIRPTGFMSVASITVSSCAPRSARRARLLFVMVVSGKPTCGSRFQPCTSKENLMIVRCRDVSSRGINLRPVHIAVLLLLLSGIACCNVTPLLKTPKPTLLWCWSETRAHTLPRAPWFATICRRSQRLQPQGTGQCQWSGSRCAA